MSRFVLNVVVALIALWIIAPLFVVIMMSFTDEASFNFPPSGYSLQWYRNFFDNMSWILALKNTILVGIFVSLTATVIGTLAAIGLHKGTFFGKRALMGLLISPLVVPGILVAVGIYSVFMRFHMLGTLSGFIIAHTILALPLVVINVLSALSTFDPKLEQAASSLGAGRWETFSRITLPLILPGVIAGAVFAFVVSFDEIIISFFIQSPRMQTLPVKMFQSVMQDSDPTVAAVAVLMMMITIAMAGLTQILKPRAGRQK